MGLPLKEEMMPKLIKQTAIADLARQAKAIAEAKATLKKAEAAYDAAEKRMIAEFAAGAIAQPGDVVPTVKTTERRNVAWKEEFARVAGPAAVEAALNAVVPTVYKHIEFYTRSGERIA